MNKARKKRLKDALDLLQQANEIIATVADEEDAAFDNMPEAFQESERGQYMEDCIGWMDDAMSSIDDAKMQLEEITGG